MSYNRIKKLVNKSSSPDDDVHNSSEEQHKKKNNMSKKKKAAVICSSVVLGVFLLVVLASCYIDTLLGKTKRLTDEEIRSRAVLEAEETDANATDTPQEEIDLLNANMDAFSGLDGLLDGEDVYNVMLLGSDTREEDTIGRTDVMILVSINKETEKIYLTSFMRDCYVDIPGYSKNRLNTAFPKGSDVLFETMAENFGIKVDRYVYINFFDFISVIDKIGGIDVEIDETEMKEINKLFKEINKYLGEDKDDGKLTSYGNIHLNGKQALSYARVRHLKGSDFNRTARQRVVLQQVVEQLKKKNLLEINDLANEILPLVTTNLETSEMRTLLMNALTYMNYDLNEQRVPIDNSWSSVYVGKAEMLGIDFEMNQKFLGETIYNQIEE